MTRPRSVETGSMMPLSAPASMARRRKTSLSRRRPGMPNERCSCRPVTWISGPNRPRIARIASSAWLPEPAVDRDREDSGSTKMSLDRRCPWPTPPRPSPTRWRPGLRRPTASRDAPAAVTTTGPPAATARSRADRRSSDAELSIGRRPGRAAVRPSPMISRVRRIDRDRDVRPALHERPRASGSRPSARPASATARRR